MPKPTNVVELVKKAAVEAVEAGKPVTFLFGTVVSVSPLKIQVEQKATYTEKMLVLTRNVTDYEISMTASDQTEQPGGDSVENRVRSVEGRKKYTVHNALTVGDWVILARVQKGKKFIVLDRMVPNPALRGEWT